MTGTLKHCRKTVFSPWTHSEGRAELRFLSVVDQSNLMCFLFAPCSGTLDWMIRIQSAIQRRKTLRTLEAGFWLVALFSPLLLLFNSYCVQLRVKQASAACKLKLWSAHLVRERLVCAECQSDAMSKKDRCGGEGLDSTRWTLALAYKSGPSVDKSRRDAQYSLK